MNKDKKYLQKMTYNYKTILRGKFHSSGEEFREGVGILRYDAPLAPSIVVDYFIRKDHWVQGLVEKVGVSASLGVPRIPGVVINLEDSLTFKEDLVDLIKNHRA